MKDTPEPAKKCIICIDSLWHVATRCVMTLSIELNITGNQLKNTICIELLRHVAPYCVMTLTIELNITDVTMFHLFRQAVLFGDNSKSSE